MELTDIHNHVLFDVDDGAQSQSQSIQMLRKAMEAGVTELCLTPHLFITDPVDIQEIHQKSIVLQKNFKGIKIHCGAELMIENNIPEFIEKNHEYCIGYSKYVLIELPMFNYPVYIRDVLYRLKIKGYSPVIAHPERNLIIQNKSSEYLCEDILENGHLQVNAGSILGKYGRGAKRTALRLIENNLVSFVASDAHKPEDFINFNKAYQYVSKLFTPDTADTLFKTNPSKVMRGEDIDDIDINQIDTAKEKRFRRIFNKR